MVQASGICSIVLRHDENWAGKNCEVTYVEAAAAAQAIFDDCAGDDDTVGGKHIVRQIGHCGSTVSFGKMNPVGEVWPPQ